MKNIYIIGAFLPAFAIALSGCEKPQAPQPQITQTEDGKTQVAVQQPEDHTVRDMAIGAAGGYLLSRVLGGGGSNPAPPPVHNPTVIQKKTVIVNKTVEAPKPKVESPKSKPSYAPPRPASRPSFSSSSRRK